jgi:hypothetical protein
MLNSKIERRETGKGEYGLFAKEPLSRGEFVWKENEGEECVCMNLTVEEALKLPEEQKKIFLHFCYQVDENELSGHLTMEEVMNDDAFFMNHSCDPTVWWEDETLVARRDISAGEEITYDYGTDFTAFDRGFTCRCGAPQCRGTLLRDDWKRLKDVYGEEHLIGYIRRKLL